MTKKYAPQLPDAKWHRRSDTAYLSELVTATGLSLRAVARTLGINERAMRYKTSGKNDVTYAEQYCLEVLADNAQHLRVETESSGA